MDAVPGLAAGQYLVVCRGGLQFLLGVEVGNVDQLAVGETPHARDPFVQGVVVLPVIALQFPAPFSTDEVPRGVDPDGLVGAPVAERHTAAVRTEGFVDQRGGGRPVGTVERHRVQRS